MSLWMAAKGEYVYFLQHLESLQWKLNVGIKRCIREDRAPHSPQAKHPSLPVTSGSGASTAALCSKTGLSTWPASCAAACTLHGGVPESIGLWMWRVALQELLSCLWKVKVPRNKPRDCQTAAAACSATRQHQLRPRLRGGQITSVWKPSEPSLYWEVEVWHVAGHRAATTQTFS